MTRRQQAGNQMADALIEWCHMMYNHQTAKGVINSVIQRLEKRVNEYVPVKQERVRGHGDQTGSKPVGRGSIPRGPANTVP